MSYGWLSDQELAEKVEQFRVDAHKAPKGGAENNGSNAWAARSRDWEEASNELERRHRLELPQPAPDPYPKVKRVRALLVEEGRVARRAGWPSSRCPSFKIKDMEINWKLGWRREDEEIRARDREA